MGSAEVEGSCSLGHIAASIGRHATAADISAMLQLAVSWEYHRPPANRGAAASWIPEGHVYGTPLCLAAALAAKRASSSGCVELWLTMSLLSDAAVRTPGVIYLGQRT